MAKLANVSTTTVSNVLNNRPGVSAKTAKLVRDIIQELGYDPGSPEKRPGPKKSLFRQPRQKPSSSQRETTFAFLIPLPSQLMPERTNATAEVLLGAHNILDALGYRLIHKAIALHTTRELKNFCDSTANLRGLVFSRLDNRAAAMIAAFALKRKLPVVFLNRNDELPGPLYCSVDHRESGQLAAEYLIKLGHRNLGVTHLPTPYYSEIERISGIRLQLQKKNIPADHLTLIADNVDENKFHGQLLELCRSKKITALLLHNDRSGARVLQCLSKAGIRVPEDISVITFDGTDLCNCTNPRMASIQIPWKEMSESAFKLLIWQAEDKLLTGARLSWKSCLSQNASCQQAPQIF